MTIGTGLAIAGMWLSIAAIILGYEKMSEKAGFSPFGVLVVICVAAAASASMGQAVH